MLHIYISNSKFELFFPYLTKIVPRSNDNMSQRTKACFAFPAAVCVFLSIPLIWLLPIVVHLEPTTLEHLDSAAAHIFGSTSSAIQDPTLDTSPQEHNENNNGNGNGNDISNTESYTVGQVFTHAQFRYQGVITRVLTNHEKRANSLVPLSGEWFECLVDIRYKKGGVSDHVLAEHINLIYPGEGNFKHPKLSKYFGNFDSETSSYVAITKKQQQHQKKKKTRKTAKKQQKMKKKATKKKKKKTTTTRKNRL